MFCCCVIYTHRVTKILSNECFLLVNVSVKITNALLTFLVLVIRPDQITVDLFVIILLFKRR
jgi:hypothetical protein